jgi:hypothetical protein
MKTRSQHTAQVFARETRARLTLLSLQSAGMVRERRRMAKGKLYSHSIVPGGFEVMS